MVVLVRQIGDTRLNSALLYQLLQGIPGRLTHEKLRAGDAFVQEGNYYALPITHFDRLDRSHNAILKHTSH